MPITLTAPELATLELLQQDTETPEDTLHRLLVPFVAAAAETRLQNMADAYRAMSPEDQLTLTSTATNLKDAAALAITPPVGVKE